MARFVLLFAFSIGCGGALTGPGGPTAEPSAAPANVRDAVAELPHFEVPAGPAPQGMDSFFEFPIEAYLTAEIDAKFLELADRAAFRVTRDGAPVGEIEARGGDYKDGWASRTINARLDITTAGEYAAELLLDGTSTGMIAGLSVGPVPCIGGTARVKAYARAAPHLDHDAINVEGWRPRDERGAIVVEWQRDGTTVGTVASHPQDGLIAELDRVTTDAGVWTSGILYATGWDWTVESFDRPDKDAPMEPGAWTVRILRAVGPSTEVSFQVGADGAITGEHGRLTVQDPRSHDTQNLPLASRTIELDVSDRAALRAVKAPPKPAISAAEVRTLTRSREALDLRMHINDLLHNTGCGGASFEEFAEQVQVQSNVTYSEHELRLEYRAWNKEGEACDAREKAKAKRKAKAELPKLERLVRKLGGPWLPEEHATEP